MPRPISFALAFVVAVGCSKKKEPPVTATPQTESAPSTSASAPQIVEAPKESVDAAPKDDAIESTLLLWQDFVLGDGKPVPAPKVTPPDKDARKAHVDRVQAKFEQMVKDGCKELWRFNASHVPATYIHCRITGKSGARLTESTPDVDVFHAFEQTSHSEEVLATRGGAAGLNEGDTTPFALWQTPRGYFLDLLGDGTYVYILRREIEVDGVRRHECRGKRGTEGGVGSVAIPLFPTRGLDVDGDGSPEFPAVAFSFPFAGWSMAVTPPIETACDGPRSPALSLDVVGAQRWTASGGGATWWSEAQGFYERKLAKARARAKKLRALLEKPAPRKTIVSEREAFRSTNACALDVAQTAAEIHVYARTLGAKSAPASAEADEVMKGFTLKLSECPGLTFAATVTTPDEDRWPAVRAALLDVKNGADEKDAPAPEASAPSGATAAASVSAAASASTVPSTGVTL